MATDKFGSLPLDPVPSPVRGETKGDVIGSFQQPAGDNLIFYLGEYLKTVINAKCGPAWAQIEKFDSKTMSASGRLPVNELDYVDPEDRAFNARDLPALYLYRDSFPATKVGDDMYAQTSRVAAYWVPSPAVLQRRQERATFVNAIAAVINRAIIRGRDPSWIVPGDTDPDAADFGSSLLIWTGCYAPIALVESKRSVVQIEGHEGTYTGLKVLLQTKELLHEDLALRYTQPTPENPVAMDTGIHQLQADGDGTSAFIVEFEGQ
jgi:hypothetical protein